MRGNTDRRGPRKGHGETLDKLRQAADSAEGQAAVAATSMREVGLWVDTTGLTGYYASERDQAARQLLTARDAARQLARDIDSALAQIRSIPSLARSTRPP